MQVQDHILIYCATADIIVNDCKNVTNTSNDHNTNNENLILNSIFTSFCYFWLIQMKLLLNCQISCCCFSVYHFINQSTQFHIIIIIQYSANYFLLIMYTPDIYFYLKSLLLLSPQLFTPPPRSVTWWIEYITALDYMTACQPKSFLYVCTQQTLGVRGEGDLHSSSSYTHTTHSQMPGRHPLHRTHIYHHHKQLRC